MIHYYGLYITAYPDQYATRRDRSARLSRPIQHTLLVDELGGDAFHGGWPSHRRYVYIYDTSVGVRKATITLHNVPEATCLVTRCTCLTSDDSCGTGVAP